MAILFATTSIQDFRTVAGSLVSSSAAGNASNVYESFATTTGTANSIVDFSGTPLTEFWVSFTYQLSSLTARRTSGSWFQILSESGSVILNTAFSATSNISFQRGNGSGGYVGVGGTLTIAGGLHFIDIHVKMGVGGFIRIYHDKVLHAQVSTTITTNTGTGTGGTSLRFYPTHASGTGVCRFTSLMAADEDTRPMRFIQGQVNGASTPNEFTGAYTNINAAGINDATFVSGVTGQAQAYTKVSPSLGPGEEVIAFSVSSRSRRVNGTPDVRFSLQSDDGVEEVGPITPGASFAPRQVVINGPESDVLTSSILLEVI